MKHCPECEMLHCPACDERYSGGYSTFISIHIRWRDSSDTGHIVALDATGSGRVLCSGDLLQAAEEAGYVPVNYGERP